MPFSMYRRPYVYSPAGCVSTVHTNSQAVVKYDFSTVCVLSNLLVWDLTLWKANCNS